MEAKEKPPITLDPGRFKFAESERNVFVANAGEGTTPDDILRTDYWAHVAQQLQPYSKIEVRADDGTWYAELLVLAVDRVWARVHLLCLHSLTDGDISQSQAAALEPFRIEWKGPQNKWTVIRKTDSETVSKGHDSKQMAANWATERMKAG